MTIHGQNRSIPIHCNQANLSIINQQSQVSWSEILKLQQTIKTPNYCMALKIIDHGSREYQQMVQLRNDILRKPLRLTFTPEELEKEKDEILIGAFEEEKMLGCCMLIMVDPATVRLRQMAVLNNLQGKGHRKSINAVCRKHRPRPRFQKNHHACPQVSCGFLRKIRIPGLWRGIRRSTLPHYEMQKKL